MKKYLFPLLVLLLNIYLVSCNGNSGNNAKYDSTVKQKNNGYISKDSIVTLSEICSGIDNLDPCENLGGIANVGGIANFIIDSKKAKRMMGDFITIYGRDDQWNEINAFASSYWINACTVYGIENFLKTQTDQSGKLIYDGIRIYLGCEVVPDLVTFPNEQYQNKTSLFIFPTKKRIPSPGNSQSTHIDEKIKISVPGCNSPFLQDNSVAKNKIEAFDKVYRKSELPKAGQKDSLSKSVWIDACVIFTIAKLLRLPNANLDGVNINLAAYGFKNPDIASQDYEQQSTLIIVPSYLKFGEHRNNWAVVECLYSHFFSKAANF